MVLRKTFDEVGAPVRSSYSDHSCPKTIPVVRALEQFFRMQSEREQTFSLESVVIPTKPH